MITAAQPADAGELLTLQRAAFMPEGRLNGSFEIPPLTESLADVAASLATGVVLVARLRGRLVGAVRGEERPGGRWYVGRLMVAPDLQRQGIGSVLMDAIEALAPAGTEAYALFTGAASAATLGYYRRRGYVETERRVTDDGVPVVVLERAVQTAEPAPAARRAAQPRYGGATPQPQRGTGASRTTSAPTWELCMASRVAHSA